MIESPSSLFEAEWIFNRGSRAPPNFGVCFSGGGNRSAAFAIGVLSALHDRGLLRNVDVISAVSGGSYALSWLLLQPLYHNASVSDPRAALPQVQEEMFDVRGSFQRYLAREAKPLGAVGWMDLLPRVAIALSMDLIAFNVLRLLSMPFGGRTADIAAKRNAYSVARGEYREGVQHTYQVFPDLEKKAPAKRPTFLDRVIEASEFLGLTTDDVSPVSFPDLSAFAQRAGLPSFVFNSTVVPPRPADRTPLSHRVF